MVNVNGKKKRKGETLKKFKHSPKFKKEQVKPTENGLKKDEKLTDDNNLARIHNIRYYNIAPRSIQYMACNQAACKLAIARMDASIEIWDIAYIPYLQKSIMGLTPSIEGLVWVNDRLFSGGLTGEITEWDLTLLKPKKSIFLTGNSIWCLDVNKTNTSIAAGTEEGFLNIVSVEDSEINHEKTLDRQEGRILCCKFDHTGDFLVTGSIDVIRIWNIKLGHVIHKMSTGRATPNQETIVWSLHFFKDFTIVSGDSRGCLTFWDGKLGSQIESNKTTKADILCITVNEKEDLLYCSGVDPIVKSFTCTSVSKENNANNKWVRTFQRTTHTHDVKSLIHYNRRILSGGVDGILASTTETLTKPLRFGPFLPTPAIIVSEKYRMTLFKYYNYLEIWRLGESLKNEILCDNKTGEIFNTGVLNIEKVPEKLLELRSLHDEPILSATISSDGNLLTYTTNSVIRIYRFQVKMEGPPSLSRIFNLPEEFTPCNLILFSPNSKSIFLSKNGGTIDVFNIQTYEKNTIITFKQTINSGTYLKDVIHLMNICDSGQYLICSGICGNINVWKIKNNKWEQFISLPKYILPPISITFRPKSSNLIVTFSNKKIYEYSLEECTTIFSAFIATIKSEILRVVCDPRNSEIILIYTDSSINLLNPKIITKNDKKLKKVPRLNIKVTDEDAVEISRTMKLIKNYYGHLIHLSWLSNDEMVAVEVLPISLIHQLPSALKKKQFGLS